MLRLARSLPIYVPPKQYAIMFTGEAFYMVVTKLPGPGTTSITTNIHGQKGTTSKHGSYRKKTEPLFIPPIAKLHSNPCPEGAESPRQKKRGRSKQRLLLSQEEKAKKEEDGERVRRQLKPLPGAEETQKPQDKTQGHPPTKAQAGLVGSLALPPQPLPLADTTPPGAGAAAVGALPGTRGR